MNGPKLRDPVDLHIGARIRMRRMQLGLTQSDVARVLDLTFQQVQKYERGYNRVAGSRMKAIAARLGVEPGFFFEGLGSSHDPVPADSPIAAFDSFSSSREGLIIAQAFVLIKNPKVRAAIAGFVRDVAEAQVPEVL